MSHLSRYVSNIYPIVFLLIFSGCFNTTQDNKDKIYKFIEFMPKAELHVHLEGSISPEILLKLAERNKIELSVKTATALSNFFKFKDFKHFVHVYSIVTNCLKTVGDYELIAYEFGRQCAAQKIKYVEATFTIASNCASTGLSWQDILNGLNKGRARAESEFKIKINWILDIVRELPETQDLVLRAALNSINNGVIGIGLSGTESKFSSKPFAQTLNQAHEKGLKITPHAGEFTVNSIWDVINNIPVDRIGHGVQCFRDPKLMELLKEKQIPLEICPTSNICTGAFPDFKSHPLRKLWDAGLFLTVNSDDPALFNTNLTQEYKILVDHFDFKLDDLEKISLNAVKASFLSEDQKLRLIQEFRGEFAQLRKKLEL